MQTIDWQNFLYWPAPLIGFGAVALGLLTLIKKDLAADAFGLPGTGRELLYLAPLGARNLAVGFATLGFCALGLRDALGILFLSLMIPAVVDATLTLRAGQRAKALIHALGFFVLGGYGAWLVGWLGGN